MNSCGSVLDGTCWYTFSWTLLPDNRNVNTQVGISLTEDKGATVSTHINSTLLTYKDPNFTVRSNLFLQGDIIYFLHDIDDEYHTLIPYDVWICFPSNRDTLLLYDPNNGDFGCLQDFLVPLENRYHICDKGRFLNGTAWSVYTYTLDRNKSVIGVGIQFHSVNPSIPYYIHITSYLDRSKRSILVMKDTSTINRIIFIPSNSHWIILLVALLPVGISLFCVIGIFCMILYIVFKH